MADGLLRLQLGGSAAGLGNAWGWGEKNALSVVWERRRMLKCLESVAKHSLPAFEGVKCMISSWGRMWKGICCWSWLAGCLHACLPACLPAVRSGLMLLALPDGIHFPLWLRRYNPRDIRRAAALLQVGVHGDDHRGASWSVVEFLVAQAACVRCDASPFQVFGNHLPLCPVLADRSGVGQEMAATRGACSVHLAVQAGL